ncbi:MAG: triose-phosphate isomerase [Patescibacteria group bacterium]|nr:triose-phosphate isomerase [Patescibacteria group bacterium]
MSKERNKIIIANWKMRLMLGESLKMAEKFKEKFRDFAKEEVVVCPSSVVLSEIGRMFEKTKLKLGAQNVFFEESGSYTGEISPKMILEAGCQYAIIGHSERRRFLLENYAMIHQKVKETLNTPGLIPIVCIGEESEERKTDKRDFVLVDQLQQALGGINILENQQVVVAYEPVWAIGSGLAIEPAEADYAHKIIGLALKDMFGLGVVNKNFRIIYGGSVTSKNVKSFAELENIDGLLVGGASLDPEEFYKIAKGILR